MDYRLYFAIEVGLGIGVGLIGRSMGRNRTPFILLKTISLTSILWLDCLRKSILFITQQYLSWSKSFLSQTRVAYLTHIAIVLTGRLQHSIQTIVRTNMTYFPDTKWARFYRRHFQSNVIEQNIFWIVQYFTALRAQGSNLITQH